MITLSLRPGNNLPSVTQLRTHLIRKFVNMCFGDWPTQFWVSIKPDEVYF